MPARGPRAERARPRARPRAAAPPRRAAPASVLVGIEPLTLLSLVGIVSTLLTYPLYVLAIAKYDKKIDLLHVVPFFFMFPYWLMIMFVYILCIPEIFRKHQYNRWKKNE